MKPIKLPQGDAPDSTTILCINKIRNIQRGLITNNLEAQDIRDVDSILSAIATGRLIEPTTEEKE